jgi:hypothetical protein
MSDTYINDKGVVKEVLDLWTKDAGQWYQVQNAWLKDKGRDLTLQVVGEVEEDSGLMFLGRYLVVTRILRVH